MSEWWNADPSDEPTRTGDADPDRSVFVLTEEPAGRPPPPRPTPPRPTPSPMAPSRARRTDRFWTIGFPLLLLAMVGAIALLVREGVRHILNSSDGTLATVITDPSQPGFEALVTPTPSLLVAVVGADDELIGVGVLALADEDTGGTILLVPANTVADLGDRRDRLVAVYEDGGLDALRDAASDLLAVSFGDAQTIDPARWEALLTPVGPLEITLPDPLVVEGESGSVVAYPAGTVSIEPGQVADVLAWVNPGESAINQLDRQERIWRAWLEAIAAGGPDLVPGETDIGVGRFVVGLSSDVFVFETLPVERVPTEFGVDVFEPDIEAARRIAVEMMPFPRAVSDGSRTRVRVYDGVGDANRNFEVARRLAFEDAQVMIVGNASAFGLAETEIRYHDDAHEAAAQRFAAALGAGAVISDPGRGGSIDVTVLIGADLPDELTGVGT